MERSTYRIIILATVSTFIFLGSGCATTSAPQRVVEAPVSAAQQAEAQRQAAVPTVKTLKRKVAIGRFTNETRYGRTFQVDANNDPLGKQVSDMLSTRLVTSQKFLVFERPDLDKVKAEQSIAHESGLVGVDALIMRLKLDTEPPSDQPREADRP